MSDKNTKILLVALYSDQHPAIGELLGIAVLGGVLEGHFNSKVELRLLDLYAVQGDRVKAYIAAVTSFQPDIMGVSVTYGSYDFIKENYNAITEHWKTSDRLVIFGGPTPTYAPEQFVPSIAVDGFVVIGEGDESIVKIVEEFRGNRNWGSVPNLYYMKEGKTVTNLRALVSLDNIAISNRSLVPDTKKVGGQIFVEASRGCSWAACTFCRRGLTDIMGRSSEYRRFSPEHVTQELRQLQDLGVSDVTFADEEFLGHLDNTSLPWLKQLEKQMIANRVKINFDISVMARSIILDTWADPNEKQKRMEIWEILKRIGLNKVFVGIESGSDSQLKRYGKNATSEQNAAAIRVLRENGIKFECGFIMFDPLCTVDEIQVNLQFVQDNDLIGHISLLTNEMRIDLGGRYHQLLENAEKAIGKQLFYRDYDPATLALHPIYASDEVSKIIIELQNWKRIYGKLHYVLKSATRYGTSGSVGESIRYTKDILLLLRRMHFERFKQLVYFVRINGDFSEVRKDFEVEMLIFADKVDMLLKDHLMSSLGAESDVVMTLRTAVRDVRTNCG